MKLIVCLDDCKGLSFNGRRQSRDRSVIERICEIVGDHILWMAPSSAALFSGYRAVIKTAENYLSQADCGDYCFLENGDISCILDKVEKIYVFWWNREYPADQYFSAGILGEMFVRTECVEFKGYSHPVIRMEVYTR